MDDRNEPQESAGMWWTQHKLALVLVGSNALVYGLVVLAFDLPLLQVVGLVAGQTMLLLIYARVARRLGARHLEGDTEDAFEARIWSRRWRPLRDKFSHPPDLIPRQEGGSFYQQLLGDTPGGREALYRALSMWEGARFLWAGGTATLAAALGSGTLALALTNLAETTGPATHIASALALPACVLLIPEAINVMLLKRSILRHGAIPRTAALVPRDAIDLGLRHESAVPKGVGREIIVILIVFSGVPILVVVGFGAGVRTATLGAAGLVAAAAAGVWFVRAFLQLLVNGLPFLHFGGPEEISVAVDLAHRQRARLSLTVLFPLLYIITWYRPVDFLPNPPSLFIPAICAGYLLAITFNDQLAGYAGFMNATHFEWCFKRSLAKARAATP